MAQMVLHGIELTSEGVRQFCRRWRIRELAVFGSVLREDFRADSDIDLLVTFEEGAPWDLLDLLEMQDEASLVLGRRVDLFSRRGIEAASNPILKQEVLGAAETVYAAS